MQKAQKLRRLIIILSISISISGCNKSSFKQVTILPGNEYIEPLNPAADDSDQILTDYVQFPDSVKSKIEKIFPGGTVEKIAHWGPFRYIVYQNFPDQLHDLSLNVIIKSF